MLPGLLSIYFAFMRIIFIQYSILFFLFDADDFVSNTYLRNYVR